MLSDDERYVRRGTGPSRDPMVPNQYGSLGPRRQSARPSAPSPPVSSSAYAMHVHQPSHAFVPNQQQDPRSVEGHSLPPSELSTSHHLPRQSHSGDDPAAHNRGSMSPPRQPSSRPSSRRALVAALSLAQEAVRLDTAGNNPQAAVGAYARSVVLLREVMNRVSSGESASSGSSRSTSRSLTPRDEEVRRLKSIVRHSKLIEATIANFYPVA